MDHVGLFCKTFKPDFDHLEVLLDSFARYNPENLALTLSLPGTDMLSFKDRFGTEVPNLGLVADEDYCQHDLTKFRGWHGQQICKFSSWRVMAADHYAVLDSDCYLIRDIHTADLVPAAGKAYVVCGSLLRTVMRKGHNLLVKYVKGEFVPTPDLFPPVRAARTIRLDALRYLKDTDLDSPGPVERSGILFEAFGADKWFFYQPGQILSRPLLHRLKEFLAGNGLSFADAILISPWEYNWYGEFAAAMAVPETDFRISPFLHFQSEEDIVWARQSGITERDIASKFLFIQMAARHLESRRFASGAN